MPPAAARRSKRASKQQRAAVAGHELSSVGAEQSTRAQGREWYARSAVTMTGAGGGEHARAGGEWE